MTATVTQQQAAAEATACWICGTPCPVVWKDRNLDRPLQPEDFRITDHRYGTTLRLRRCTACGFIFADDGEISHLLDLYEQLDDGQYEQTQSPRLLQMRWLLGKALAAHPGARTLLDIGAGTGLLVAEARRQGLEAVGVEPSHRLVEAGKRMHDIELLEGTLPHLALTSRRFDLVFLVDVLEHVSDPVSLLASCAAAVSDAGQLVVVTPDVDSLAARVLGHRWWHFRLAHVGYFSRDTLRSAGQHAGLAAERSFRTRWFFPVSYLAERLEHYLPIAWWNRLAQRSRALRWLYGRVVPLNLLDSWVMLFEHA